jgi:hypothetical protein
LTCSVIHLLRYLSHGTAAVAVISNKLIELIALVTALLGHFRVYAEITIVVKGIGIVC